MLREVKYLEARQTEAIPETAVQIYTTRGQLWQYVANLELTVGRYNKVGLDQAKSSDDGVLKDKPLSIQHEGLTALCVFI